ncbi:hypothetical protein DOJK_00132 [Patescibacteria group bacterium]|nr:hypothetical protein DOJK_00132 [Patescibacteria group bacterium]
MKKLIIILLMLSCINLVACSRGQEINGHNMKTAYRSVKGLKKYLPIEKQMEFEISFWLLRDANKDEVDFLKIIDGKKPQQIIELAKSLYEERKNAGFKGYEQYASWDDMINKFGQDRLKQDEIRKGKEEDDFKDGKTADGKHKSYPSVIYNPRAPQK